MKLSDVFDNEPQRDGGARSPKETYQLAKQISENPEGHSRNEKDLADLIVQLVWSPSIALRLWQ